MSDLAKQLRLAVMDLNLPPYRSTSILERVAYNDGARDARHAIAEILLTHPLLNGAAPATGAAPACICGKPATWVEADPGDSVTPPIDAGWFCDACGVNVPGAAPAKCDGTWREAIGCAPRKPEDTMTPEEAIRRVRGDGGAAPAEYAVDPCPRCDWTVLAKCATEGRCQRDAPASDGAAPADADYKRTPEK